ncbi:MAG: hypothetical protein AAFS03_10230, partial [Pseudomonadota bacterium]
KTAEQLERPWMTPWEKWALGQAFETGEVDMRLVPPGKDHRGEEDVDKAAVDAPLKRDLSGLPTTQDEFNEALTAHCEVEGIEPDEVMVNALLEDIKKKLAERRPEPIDEDLWPAWQILSARFLKYVCTNRTFVESRQWNRVRILHARFREKIDLAGLTLPGELWLDRCRLDAEPNLQGTDIAGLLKFQASHLPDGLSADRLKTKGSVFLRGGAKFGGTVRLLGAEIGGNLACDGSTFEAGTDGNTLAADGLTIKGNVFLQGKARFGGTVRLLGAEIGRDLDCFGSTFDGPDSDGDVFVADGLTIKGSVFLRGGASFEGNISLPGADIGGNLQLSASTFQGKVSLSRATIKAELRLDETELGMAAPVWGDEAELNLQNATIGALQGSLAAWTRQSDGEFVPRNLDGLSFNRLAGGVGGNSLDRASPEDICRWLNTGTGDEDDPHFSASPYLAVAGALKASGREERARKVRIALEERRSRSIGWGLLAWKAPRRLFRFLSWAFTAHGYRPARALLWLGGAVIAFGTAGLAWEFAHLERSVESLDWSDVRAWAGFSLETAFPLFDLDPVNDTFLEDRFQVG